MTQQAWDKELRARGYRVTPQRQLVLEAVTKLEHASPEEIWADVQQTASGVNISTIYRALELLEQLGLVTHTHLGHGAPRYHLAAEADHVHLVCSSCGRITQVPPDAVEALVSALDESDGFQTDVGHLTVFGRCASCRAGDRAAGPGDAAAVGAMPGGAKHGAAKHSGAKHRGVKHRGAGAGGSSRRGAGVAAPPVLAAPTDPAAPPDLATPPAQADPAAPPDLATPPAPADPAAPPDPAAQPDLATPRTPAAPPDPTA
jgi:Fur family ferric uptake transcriptional regulator